MNREESSIKGDYDELIARLVPELAMRLLVAYAKENGFDAVEWGEGPPGIQEQREELFGKMWLTALHFVDIGLNEERIWFPDEN